MNGLVGLCGTEEAMNGTAFSKAGVAGPAVSSGILLLTLELKESVLVFRGIIGLGSRDPALADRP